VWSNCRSIVVLTTVVCQWSLHALSLPPRASVFDVPQRDRELIVRNAQVKLESCVFCLAGSSWPSLPHQICCLAEVLPNNCGAVLLRLYQWKAHLFNWLLLSRQACHIEHWCVGQRGWMWLDMTLLACTYCARVHLQRRLPGDAKRRISSAQTWSIFIFWRVQETATREPPLHRSGLSVKLAQMSFFVHCLLTFFYKQPDLM